MISIFGSNKQEATEKISLLSIVSSIITIISFFVPGFSIIKLIFDISNQNTNSINIWVILIIVFGIIAVLLFLNRRKISVKVLRWIMNLTAPKQSYKVLYKTCEYEYLSRTELRYEKRIKPKPIQNIDGIHDQFNWTGNKNLTPKSLYPKTQYVELKDRKFGMQRYDVKFKNNRIFKKGEDVPELGMVIDCISDPNKESSTHLSSGVYEITDKLTLRVWFNPNLTPRNFRKLTYLHYTDREHYSCDNNVRIEVDNDSNKNFVEWEIDKPIFGAKYLIDWDM